MFALVACCFLFACSDDTEVPGDDASMEDAITELDAAIEAVIESDTIESVDGKIIEDALLPD